jgi:hypothetical protein
MIRSMANETIPPTLNKFGNQFCCQQLELLLITQPKQHVRLLMKERLLQNEHLPSVERCLISNGMISSCISSDVTLLFSVGGTPEGRLEGKAKSSHRRRLVLRASLLRFSKSLALVGPCRPADIFDL